MKTLIIFLALLLPAFLCGQTLTENIHIDQFGYKPDGQKVAILSNPQLGYNAGQTYVPGTSISVVDNQTLQTVFSAAPAQWNGGNTHGQSGDRVWWFDFSQLTNPGDYYVYDPANNLRSYAFRIDDNVYSDALRQSTRAFYYQRCGVAKTVLHGGVWHD